MLGQTIAHYKILVKIGGMGEVYLAHDTKLDRKVARKVLHPGSEERRRPIFQPRLVPRWSRDRVHCVHRH